MLLGAEQEIAKAKMSKDVSELARERLFGYKTKANWNDTLARYLIIEMFNCSGGKTLNQCDIDCLNSKLTSGLTNNCC